MALQPNQRAAMRGQFKTQARATGKALHHQQRVLSKLDMMAEEKRQQRINAMCNEPWR